MSNNYNEILMYLEKYAGKEYRNPNKCIGVEKEQNLKARDGGKKAVDLFKSLINNILQEIKLEPMNNIIHWQRKAGPKAPQCVNYLWTQLKDSKYKNSDISLAIFAEKMDDKYRYRTCIEIKDNPKNDSDELKYKKLQDIPLEKNLVYIVGGKNKGKIEILDERDNMIVKSQNHKKVQVAYIIDNPKDDDDLIYNLKKNVKVLLKYYYYVMNDDMFSLNQEEKERIDIINNNTSILKDLEKEVVIKVRVNQDKFRDELIKKYESKCCLCGVNNDTLLIASHIKPWAKSNDYEKIDKLNGLLLCPNHDKLFDSGYISFDDKGKILISNTLNSVNQLYMNINSNMKIDMSKVNEKYIRYHRENRYKW